jgi:amino acid adenylation domain-containing protein
MNDAHVSGIVEDRYPLSSVQEGMLFQNLFAPGSGVDVEQIVFHLTEDVRAEFFREAWRSLVARHAALRTCFEWEGLSEPVQAVYGSVELPWQEEDWQGAGDAEVAERIQRRLNEERKRGFDLGRPPLLRCLLIRVKPAEYFLCWTFSHAVLDGRSYPTLIRELFAFYNAARDGTQVRLEPLLPYRKYIEWLGTRDHASAESFWRNGLAGFYAPTPVIRSMPLVPAGESVPGYGEEEVTFSPELSSSLQALASREQQSMSTILHSAWALLLSRYCGEEDVVFGVARAGRRGTVQGAESMVGLFLNTLPLRVRVSPSASVGELMKTVKGALADIRGHEHTPLPRIREWSEVPRGQSLFHSLFVFETYSLNTLLREQGGEWRNRDFRMYGKTVYPLMVSLYAGQELRLRLRYHLDWFRAAEVRRMLGHWTSLLEGFVSDPSRECSTIPIVTQAERTLLTVTWNRTAMSYASGETVHGLFEKQAAKTPDAIAVEFEESTLSYRELNALSDILAARLRKAGVKPGVNAGIFVERSAEMIAGLLGILKAGGAYVPLDPSYPADRLAFMISDGRIPVLLTEESLRQFLPPHDALVVILDEAVRLARGKKVPEHESVSSAGSAGDLAYVIFTSGSTGRPKGVEIRHQAVVNFLASMRREPGLTAADVVLSVTTLSFDIAGLELYLPLTTGGRVAVASRNTAVDGKALAAEIQKRNATLMQATPATWRLLLESGWQPRPGFVMLCGGEALPRELADPLLKTGGILWNMYGPTETTIWSTLRKIEPGTDPISIGRPIGNTQVYILDVGGHPVPVGVPGELLIGGDGLARGYLGRPELTTEKFIPDTFTGVPGARLYRTGDLARYLEDGTIECLGRLDHQVKIRGFRIELGEVESILSQVPGVRQSAVAVREDASGQKGLVGYVVIDKSVAPSTGEMRRQMRAHLPDYMIPGVIVTLDVMPLTPNGKVDRKALPAPDASRPDREHDHVPPRDPLEKQLTELWERVFEIHPIGIRDNFFDLGGHSLLAVRIFAQVEKATGKSLPLVTLFQAPTIEQIAALLRDEGWRAPWTSLVPIQPAGTRPPFYCVHGVGGNILEYMDMGRHLDTDQPLYGLQAQGLDGKMPRHTTVEEMAEHYKKEIREFQPHGPYYVGGASFGGLVAHEVARLLLAEGEEIPFLGLFDTTAPGYPKYLPTTTALGKKVNHFLFRVELHWSNLKSLGVKKRWEYVRVKVVRLGNRVVILTQKRYGRTRRWLEQLFYPQTIRKVQRAGQNAMRDYVPKPYPGKATLFRATEQPYGIYEDRTNGWGAFELGELEIYDIPGHHGAITREPRVEHLTRVLTECLIRAQSGARVGGANTLTQRT